MIDLWILMVSDLSSRFSLLSCWLLWTRMILLKVREDFTENLIHEFSWQLLRKLSDSSNINSHNFPDYFPKILMILFCQAPCQVELDNWVNSIHSACAAAFARHRGKTGTLHLLQVSVNLDKCRFYSKSQLFIWLDGCNLVLVRVFIVWWSYDDLDNLSMM